LDRRFLRSIARQKIDVLDREKQLVAAGIVDFEAIMRRPGGFDSLQADKPADAVIDVDHEIAGRQARRFGDKVFRATRASPWTHQSVAKDVLLAYDRSLIGFESGFDAKDSKCNRLFRQRKDFIPVGNQPEIAKAVVGKHVTHSIPRT